MSLPPAAFVGIIGGHWGLIFGAILLIILTILVVSLFEKFIIRPFEKKHVEPFLKKLKTKNQKPK